MKNRLGMENLYPSFLSNSGASANLVRLSLGESRIRGYVISA
jgi:hypothetical protein